MSNQQMKNVICLNLFVVGLALWFSGIFDCIVSNVGGIATFISMSIGSLLMIYTLAFARDISYNDKGDEILGPTVFEDLFQWIKKRLKK